MIVGKKTLTFLTSYPSLSHIRKDRTLYWLYLYKRNAIRDLQKIPVMNQANDVGQKEKETGLEKLKVYFRGEKGKRRSIGRFWTIASKKKNFC